MIKFIVSGAPCDITQWLIRKQTSVSHMRIPFLSPDKEHTDTHGAYYKSSAIIRPDNFAPLNINKL